MMEAAEAIAGKTCQKEVHRRVGVTFIFFIISLIIALYVPSIGSVIALLGGSAALFVFVFPGKL